MMQQFEADVLLLPQWVQIWMNVIGLSLAATVIILLFSKSTRKDALVIVALSVPAIASIILLHAQMGMVKLLGLGHVIFWTPLLIYLVGRMRRDPPPKFFAFVMGVFIAVLTITLVFDYLDVIRWVLGERKAVV